MPEKSVYPVKRWIRMIDVSGPQPGYAPLEEQDPLDAYSPFLHPTEAAASAELEEDIKSRASEIEAGEREEDDLLDDYIASCTVHEDGRIEFEGFELSRAFIFEVYGVADPARRALAR